MHASWFASVAIWPQVNSVANLQTIGMPPRSAVGQHVDFEQAVAQLQGFAVLKEPPFNWSISGYGKNRRSQGPDREGLALYRPLLRIILGLAPAGFPSMVSLRYVWTDLNRSHKLKDNPDISEEAWANAAASAIRLMCKHIVDIARSSSPLMHHGLRDLVALVDLPQSEASAPSSPPRAPRVLVPHDSLGSSVQICGMLCQCEKCRKPIELDAESTQPSVPAGIDSVSEEAHRIPASHVVPPAKGAVREAVAGMKRPASASSSKIFARPASKKPASNVACRIKLVKRLNPPSREGAYLLLDGSYLLGLNASAQPAYLHILEQLRAQLLASREPITKELAGRLVADLLE